MRALVFDFETANSAAYSACAIGLVILEDFKIVHEEHRLIRTPTPNFQFTAIHGLSYADVEFEKTFAEIWPEFEPHFAQATVWVGHNIAFDQRVLQGTLNHYGLRVPVDRPSLCTVRLARNFLGIRPANLANVSKVLGIDLQHHHALSDARATAKILIHAVQQGLDPSAWMKPGASSVAPASAPTPTPHQPSLLEAAISPLNSASAAEKLKKLLTVEKPN